MKSWMVEVETNEVVNGFVTTYQVAVRARHHEEAERVAEDSLDIPYSAIIRMRTREVETVD